MNRGPFALILAFVGLIGAENAEQSRQRQNDSPLVQFQLQLEKLQDELKSLRASNRQGHQANDNIAQEIMGEELSSLDRFSVPQRRGVGWQPLKRSGSADPPSSFQLGFNSPTNQRQQMLDAIEEHLLHDLDTARQYGIESQAILRDLRAKSLRDQDRK